MAIDTVDNSGKPVSKRDVADAINAVSVAMPNDAVVQAGATK